MAPPAINAACRGFASHIYEPLWLARSSRLIFSHCDAQDKKFQLFISFSGNWTHFPWLRSGVLRNTTGLRFTSDKREIPEPNLRQNLKRH